MLVQAADRRVLSVIFFAALLLIVFLSRDGGAREPQVLEQPIDKADGRVAPVIKPVDPVWPTEPFEATHTAPTTEEKPKWQFNSTEHERDYSLSNEQCDLAFPGLWANIDSVANHRSALGPITESVVEKSFVNEGGAELARVLIYDRQIYIVDDIFSFHKNRAASILSTINRAIIAYSGDIPNVEFVLNVRDGPTGEDQWALTREDGVDKTTWLMTDHGWWSWPVPLLGEYTAIRKQIQRQEPAWEEKKPKAAWRGVANLSPIRASLLEAVQDKPWADIRSMSWTGNGGSGGAENKDDALTALDHCSYQYLVYTEGATYSGRFKYLHSCNSVIITHKLKWAEFHAPMMITEGYDQNIVHVERDWSDLNEKMEYLIANPDIAQRIAENGAKTFRDRYLTPAAQACYTRRMISAWAALQAFEPQLWEYKEDINGHKVLSLRGKSFETWMVQPMV